ncbi:uncharacterized protein LOC130957270 [Arachis stenosperma]|uniref:uncharacterized protein LOC130957270 n=1 Tax=Arachis stenosperma TaxID=217475 RepID=UPI0025AC0A78|nr:uncharacterized protein LOC130957270 [Arachis stenosperma]
MLFLSKIKGHYNTHTHTHTVNQGREGLVPRGRRREEEAALSFRPGSTTSHGTATTSSCRRAATSRRRCRHRLQIGKRELVGERGSVAPGTASAPPSLTSSAASPLLSAGVLSLVRKRRRRVGCCYQERSCQVAQREREREREITRSRGVKGDPRPATATFAAKVRCRHRRKHCRRRHWSCGCFTLDFICAVAREKGVVTCLRFFSFDNQGNFWLKLRDLSKTLKEG